MITLERFCYSDSMGTFGRMIFEDGASIFTVERPWLQNEPSVSCIPEGEYPLIKNRYNRGGYDTYKVYPVPGRTQIKIHKGNVCTEVMGCIAVGSFLGSIGSKWAVLNSAGAFQEFMWQLDGVDEDIIRIVQTTAD